MRYLFLVLVFFIACSTIIIADQPLPSLALNHETQECTFSSAKIAGEWQIYPLTTSNIYETPYGSCQISAGNHISECCEQLKLTLINTSHLQYKNETTCFEYHNSSINSGSSVANFDIYICSCTLNQHQLYYGDVISINKKTEECAGNIILDKEKKQFTHSSSIPESQPCFSNFDDWIKYTKTSEEIKYITPVGECDSILDPESCCEQLGYTYVPEIVTGENKSLKLVLGVVAIIICIIIFYLGHKKLNKNSKNNHIP
ncbi:MAG: hypothetical protein ACP5N2_01075 [Candidatus Nanoarchaeia archaeon]